MKEGDKVRIKDSSQAHGDIGIIDCIQSNGIIFVELEECTWICGGEDELELLEVE